MRVVAMNKELSCHELVLRGFNFWECNGTIRPRKEQERRYISLIREYKITMNNLYRIPK